METLYIRAIRIGEVEKMGYGVVRCPTASRRVGNCARKSLDSGNITNSTWVVRSCWEDTLVHVPTLSY